MKKYIKYLLYILEHKKNVFIECWKEGLYLHAFTHDLSKFRSSEFIPYARYFYGDYPSQAVLNSVPGINHSMRTKEQVKDEFEKAWEHHYKNNPHHWNYYNGEDMEYKDIDKMLCDWKAMSRKFGGTAQEFYLKNYKKMHLSFHTRMYIESLLDLNFSEVHGYGHTMEQFAEKYDRETYDGYFGWIKERYKIDTYEMLKQTN
ncbi:MAG: DUF5662 family protein [Sarcina sp.]